MEALKTGYAVALRRDSKSRVQLSLASRWQVTTKKLEKVFTTRRLTQLQSGRSVIDPTLVHHSPCRSPKNRGYVSTRTAQEL